MYIKREMESECRSMLQQFPVITIIGPRQSGKTTMVRHLFSDLPYYNFENPDVRMLIQQDPRRFLQEIPNGAVLDEIHKVPELPSYIQQIADEKKNTVRFVLTGSSQLLIMQKVTQSLAGRTAILKLLPLSLRELGKRTSLPTDDLLFNGFYPVIWADKTDPLRTYRSYYETYLQRDVRQLIQLRDQHLFQKFIGICAGRIGSLFNATAVAGEVGVSVPTVKSWLSVLEASFVVILLQPWHENVTSRLIKTPKLYFCDTGLAAYLLGIERPEQIKRDPLRGMLFENMVVMELIKRRYNQGVDHPLYFYRDNHHNEIDLVMRDGTEAICVEIKSASTYHPDFLRILNRAGKLINRPVKRKLLVYDGDLEQKGETELVNVRNIDLF
ncbi:MAG: ATP-binding protein [Deltaproteobacteria bacterium]|nr:ATP-binding protein [Deltaproteobacteria bacterium]MBL7113717.1 ATP-binding protein [Bacteroidales bacterium]